MRNLPVSLARTLPGNLVEPYRAGIQTMIFGFGIAERSFFSMLLWGNNTRPAGKSQPFSHNFKRIKKRGHIKKRKKHPLANPTKQKLN
jgi:hypothetical protein